MLNKEAAVSLEEYLRLASFPVAVKISEGKGIPEKARRPMEFLGHPITLCQGISMARYTGWTVGFSKEDHGCAPSQVLLGLEKEPEMIKSGDYAYPLYGETLESCARIQETIPLLPLGRAERVVVAPLSRAEFEPDVVLVYGMPAQVARLIQGALYRRGGTITSSFAGRMCTNHIISPLLEQRCQVVIPGSGERFFAHTQDHEMCFSIPGAQLEEVIAGVMATHKEGATRFPTIFSGLRSRPKFPDKFHKLEEMFGITNPLKAEGV